MFARVLKMNSDYTSFKVLKTVIIRLFKTSFKSSGLEMNSDKFSGRDNEIKQQLTM